MKKIGITLRIEEIEHYSEKRDCLDQRWYKLIFQLGCLPVLLPNIEPNKIELLINELQLDAIILSGGNSISSLEQEKYSSPERDVFEKALIFEAIKQKIPVLGVCRGMQMINLYFGGKVSKILNHVNCKHRLISSEQFFNYIPKEVHSYHNWGITKQDLALELDAFAFDEKEKIEGFVHQTFCIAGIMWHPEREDPLNEHDIKLAKRFLL